MERLEIAVRQVFSTSDFHNADMRTLASKAEMGFGTIYKYFGDKDGLLFYFVNYWQDKINSLIIEHLEGLSDSREKLRKIQWVILNYLENNPDIGRVIYLTIPMTTWMKNETFAQRSLSATILNTIKEAQVNGQVRCDVSSVVILDLMLGFIRRAFTMWIYRGEVSGLASLQDQMFDLFWFGVQTDVAPCHQSSLE